MLIDIQKCTQQFLKNIFSPLDEFEDYVFWIRNHDNSRQIYVSPSYENIWQRDAAILFDIPLMWLDYLAIENKNAYMQQLQDRHVAEYLDPNANIVYYEISQPSNESRFLRDQCFKCRVQTGEEYLAGISRDMPVSRWRTLYQQKSKLLEDAEREVHRKFFAILRQTFGFTIINQPKQKTSIANEYREYLPIEQQFSLSKRELECLQHFCQGKTYKQAARAMAISHRTVETHLENILHKTACSNKLEVVSRFSHYFSQSSIHKSKK